MGDFKINEKTVFTQSGSAEPAMGSTITGIPAAGVTGVLPVGVTGGSGLTAAVSFARLGTGATKLLWRNSTGTGASTHSTVYVFLVSQILGTVPTTTNYLLMEVNVRYRVEYSCSGLGLVIGLNNTGSSHSTYNSSENITPSNYSSLDDTNTGAYYNMGNINPDGPAYTAWVSHFSSTFMFDGSSQFHASTNYVYLSGINLTGSGAYTAANGYINGVTMWEIQK